MEQSGRYWGESRNSCTITTPKGEVQTLTVPVYGSRRPQPYREIRICYMHAWQRQHWASLYSAYGKKPYWEYYADYIRPLYETRYEYLWQLNERTEYISLCLINNVPPGDESNFSLALSELCERFGERVPFRAEKGLFLDFLMEFGPECHHLAL